MHPADMKAAMNAVVMSMGQAARNAKAKRLTDVMHKPMRDVPAEKVAEYDEEEGDTPPKMTPEEMDELAGMTR